MSGSPFALLWSKILDSSVWALDHPTRIVWITLLALKDANGVVKMSVPGLANRAVVTLPECEAALRKFKEPDAYSQSPAEEGRRIKEVPGGWLIINHEEYRFASEAKRFFWRELKAKQRERKAKGQTGPITGETLAVAAMGRGDEASADALAAERREAKVPPRPTASRSSVGRPLPPGPTSDVAGVDGANAVGPHSPAGPVAAAPAISPLPGPLPPARPGGGAPAEPPQGIPAARGPRTAGQVLAGMRLPARRRSSNNPLAGGWQERVVPTGVPVPASPSSNRSPASARAESPLEDEPPVE